MLIKDKFICLDNQYLFKLKNVAGQLICWSAVRCPPYKYVRISIKHQRNKLHEPRCCSTSLLDATRCSHLQWTSTPCHQASAGWPMAGTCSDCWRASGTPQATLCIPQIPSKSCTACTSSFRSKARTPIGCFLRTPDSSLIWIAFYPENVVFILFFLF